MPIAQLLLKYGRLKMKTKLKLKCSTLRCTTQSPRIFTYFPNGGHNAFNKWHTLHDFIDETTTRCSTHGSTISLGNFFLNPVLLCPYENYLQHAISWLLVQFSFQSTFILRLERFISLFKKNN